MHANAKMIEALFVLHVRRGGTLSGRLQDILARGLVEEDSCCFLAKCLQDVGINNTPYSDRTGKECYINKVTIDDEDSIRLQEQGILFAHALRQILRTRGAYKIILGFSFIDSEEQPARLTCDVRFHKERPGETWLLEDLESYPMNALLVMDSRPSSVDG